MALYDELRDKYGLWLTKEQIAEHLGLSAKTIQYNYHWSVRGVTTKKQSHKQSKRLYRTYDVARNIEHWREAHPILDKHLCKACQWHSIWSGIDGTIICAYALHPPHKSRLWHKANGMENAMDMSNCPFYVKGRAKRLPFVDIYVSERRKPK